MEKVRSKYNKDDFPKEKKSNKALSIFKQTEIYRLLETPQNFLGYFLLKRPENEMWIYSPYFAHLRALWKFTSLTWEQRTWYNINSTWRLWKFCCSLKQACSNLAKQVTGILICISVTDICQSLFPIFLGRGMKTQNWLIKDDFSQSHVNSFHNVYSLFKPIISCILIEI